MRVHYDLSAKHILTCSCTGTHDLLICASSEIKGTLIDYGITRQAENLLKRTKVGVEMSTERGVQYFTYL
jgi:hypothetical protein